jgi:hypothetical protein
MLVGWLKNLIIKAQQKPTEQQAHVEAHEAHSTVHPAAAV